MRPALVLLALAACHTHYQVIEDFELGDGGGCATLADHRRYCWGTEQTAHSAKPELQASGRPTPPPARFSLDGLTLCDHGSDCETLPAAPLSYATSPHHACVVDAAGSVWCRGDAERGRLGAGVTKAPGRLTRVRDLAGAKTVALGDDFGCVLLKNGTVACWGDNAQHALAQEDATVYATPMPVVGLFAVTALRARADQACASLTDGGLRCWGSARAGGSMGRAGGATNTVPMPVQFP